MIKQNQLVDAAVQKLGDVHVQCTIKASADQCFLRPFQKWTFFGLFWKTANPRQTCHFQVLFLGPGHARTQSSWRWSGRSTSSCKRSVENCWLYWWLRRFQNKRPEIFSKTPVQVGVGWALNVQVPATNIVERFVVVHDCHIGVFQQGVDAQHLGCDD